MAEKRFVVPSDGDRVQLQYGHIFQSAGEYGFVEGEVYTRFGKWFVDVLFDGHRITTPTPVELLAVVDAREVQK